MVAIREFRRLKQEANEIATNLVQDSSANLLEGGNDTVQPCHTTQARLDSDFGARVSTVQFYAIEHNFKSNRWIELKLYHKIPEVFFLCWGTFSSESMFRKDLRYRSEQAIRILLFTSF